MDKLNRIYELTLKKKEIEEELKRLQESIIFSEEINSNLENEKIKLTLVPSTSYQTLDTKKIEEKEPELFKDLTEMYSKTISRKAYLKVKIK